MPAPVFCAGTRLLLRWASIAAIGAAVWFTSTAIGEHLAEIRLQRISAGLPQIEMLSQQIAAALDQQGVCLDAPAQAPRAHPDTKSRIQQLHARLAVQGPCIELAIAQQQLETLEIATATIQRIHQTRIWTAGFVADSLEYRAHARHPRTLPKTPRQHEK